MTQTVKGSWAEAGANIAVGFAVNWAANMLFWPVVGLSGVSASAAFNFGLILTAVSLVRQYILRRWFNGLKFGQVAT